MRTTRSFLVPVAATFSIFASPTAALADAVNEPGATSQRAGQGSSQDGSPTSRAAAQSPSSSTAAFPPLPPTSTPATSPAAPPTTIAQEPLYAGPAYAPAPQYSTTAPRGELARGGSAPPPAYAAPAYAPSRDSASSALGSTQPDATRDAPEAGNEQETKKSEHFRIGVLGGVGFPRPLAVEGLVKVERTVALGAEYSVLPTLNVSGVETTFHALAADLRIFPLQGPFFIGLRAGRQHLGGSGTVTASGYSRQGSVTVDTTFVNPRLGFLWTFEPGFSVGIDAGAQIPLSSTTATTLPAGTAANQQALSIANAFGSTVIPTVDLLRIGFLI